MPRSQLALPVTGDNMPGGLLHTWHSQDAIVFQWMIYAGKASTVCYFGGLWETPAWVKGVLCKLQDPQVASTSPRLKKRSSFKF